MSSHAEPTGTPYTALARICQFASVGIVAWGGAVAAGAAPATAGGPGPVLVLGSACFFLGIGARLAEAWHSEGSEPVLSAAKLRVEPRIAPHYRDRLDARSLSKSPLALPDASSLPPVRAREQGRDESREIRISFADIGKFQSLVAGRILDDLETVPELPLTDSSFFAPYGEYRVSASGAKFDVRLVQNA